MTEFWGRLDARQRVLAVLAALTLIGAVLFVDPVGRTRGGQNHPRPV
ncbi:MAG: hypothetical protein R6U98_05905 [Pirellulaceae bacterium]